MCARGDYGVLRANVRLRTRGIAWVVWLHSPHFARAAPPDLQPRISTTRLRTALEFDYGKPQGTHLQAFQSFDQAMKGLFSESATRQNTEADV
jgi:hypothetical protein